MCPERLAHASSAITANVRACVRTRYPEARHDVDKAIQQRMAKKHNTRYGGKGKGPPALLCKPASAVAGTWVITHFVHEKKTPTPARIGIERKRGQASTEYFTFGTLSFFLFNGI